MNPALTFCFARVKADERDWRPLFDRFRSTPGDADIGLWGAWSGLFGVGSNEMILMTTSDRVDHAEKLNARVASASGVIVEKHQLRATARPADPRPLTRAGLYVFRFFDVRNADVDAIVALSREAWTTFESTQAYRAQPQGLFCQSDRGEPRGIMLLCTWYDGLESWQASREPPPEAAANFRARHALTQGTIAYATQLIL
jgi:hypothetical protein